MIARPAADPEADIQAALGLEQAIVFHPEPGVVAGLLDAGHLSELLAVRRAIETSSALQAALARVRVAEKDADLAGRLPNPILSLVLRDPTGSGMTQIEASLTENLLAILQRPQRASLAGNRLQAEAAAALSAALDVVADVQGAYTECQVLEARVEVLEGRLGAFDRIVEAAQARSVDEAGAEDEHEIAVQADAPKAIAADRTELSIELDGRRRDLRLARLSLARRIGEPSSAADWTLDPWSAPASAPVDEAACLASALACRPEIAALVWELRARNDEEALASGLPWDGILVGIDTEEDEHGDASTGPLVESPLPIFDTPAGHRDRARHHSAETRHKLDEVRRAVVEEVRAALWRLHSAQASLARVESELLPTRERHCAEIEEAYVAGEADVTALLLAEQALGRAQESRLQLVQEVSTALHALQRAVGGPVRFGALGDAAPDDAAPTAPTAPAVPAARSLGAGRSHDGRRRRGRHTRPAGALSPCA